MSTNIILPKIKKKQCIFLRLKAMMLPFLKKLIAGNCTETLGTTQTIDSVTHGLHLRETFTKVVCTDLLVTCCHSLIWIPLYSTYLS